MRLVRLLSFILLAMFGTCALMYCAPGYLADAREMDAMHAASAQSDLQQRRFTEGSVTQVLLAESVRLLHGDLGRSRQFEVPVVELLRERAGYSLRLLLEGLTTGWCGALVLACFAVLVQARKLDLLLAALASSLLAFPVGALATLFLLRGWTAPALVLGLVVGVRDFKILHRLFQAALRSSHILHAEAMGLSPWRVFAAHLAPQLWQEVAMVALASFTLALSVSVPVEVIFDCPGLGHLAWSAAINRDLPVLVALTAVMGLCVGTAGVLAANGPVAGDASCA